MLNILGKFDLDLKGHHLVQTNELIATQNT